MYESEVKVVVESFNYKIIKEMRGRKLNEFKREKKMGLEEKHFKEVEEIEKGDISNEMLIILYGMKRKRRKI